MARTSVQPPASERGGSAEQVSRKTSELIAELPRRRDRHRARHPAVRVGVAAGGFALLLGGLAMLVLPGPGALAVVAGLALLALEFAWAERLLHRAGGLFARASRVLGTRRGLLTLGVLAVATVTVFGYLAFTA